MSNLAVLGDSTSIMGFRPLGVDVFPFALPDEVRAAWPDILARGYAIIFMTEPLYEGVAELIEDLRAEITPAIVPIPGVAGPMGSGRREIDKLIELAVGSAIKR